MVLGGCRSFLLLVTTPLRCLIGSSGFGRLAGPIKWTCTTSVFFLHGLAFYHICPFSCAIFLSSDWTIGCLDKRTELHDWMHGRWQWTVHQISDRPILLTQCCTQFRSLGVKVLWVFHLYDNIAFTFKWYENTWNKTFYSQRIWIVYNIELIKWRYDPRTCWTIA